ncbi:hypothetical protein FKW77_007762 [Venturia effusa]|uniref:tRNA A64-2'-O-ribosylphosphate transferase n=1 Tax=Venturia effusa TaxID=50376 RepID=A0A517L3R0_9PEZI|nr:hypothetical protein FKW77_007762 [Venturia effusa]
MTKPIQTSDIIFPELATNFSSTLASLKRSTLSISNRLSSISDDAEFVCQVADAYGLPLVANERCGSWYIPPDRKRASAYFKSTDGHNGEWSMSLRRLNTQVFEVINKAKGCIIIEQRLDNFVCKLKELELDLTELRDQITKPMRPIWITRDSILSPQYPNFEGFHSVILCTASRRVHGTEVSEGGYIQGAGDDSEGWSQGLTANIFWKHKDLLMSTNEQHLPDTIAKLTITERTTPSKSRPIMIRPTEWLFIDQIDALSDASLEQVDGLITCSPKTQITQLPVVNCKHLHLDCRDRKLGSRDLRKELIKLKNFMAQMRSPKRLVVACTTGKDLSVGIVLALLCLYTDESGKFTVQATPPALSKRVIQQRTSLVMTSHPSASPSRATLQSVNDFLLTSHTAATEIPRWIHNHQIRQSYTLALFEWLRGEWAINREITNFRDDGLAGTVTGFAKLDKRDPTSSDATAEYLYVENGRFTTTTGMILETSRRWIWRYHGSGEAETPISVHFVKADGETEDYVYNMLAFPLKIDDFDVAEGLKARAEHPCGEDFYVSTYDFNMAVGKFEVQHEVKGPSKNYISHTTYTKP